MVLSVLVGYKVLMKASVHVVGCAMFVFKRRFQTTVPRPLFGDDQNNEDDAKRGDEE